MSKVITIFDSNYICQTVKAVTGRRIALSHKKQNTEVIYGFLKRILPISESLNTDISIFVWDSYDSIRKDIYPGYKKQRKEKKLTAEEEKINKSAYEQIDLLREKIIPRLGLKNNFYQLGYEGDDIIAALSKSINKKDKCYIVTRDNDMLQLLTPNVAIYDPQNKKLATEKTFYKKHGIVPEDWATVKAIAGCATDEVKGVFGIGEKTAIKYIRKELTTGKKFEDIKRNIDTICINSLLVKLPLLGTEIPQIYFNKHFDEKAFLATCTAYGIRSLTETAFINRWRKQFGG